MMFVNLKDNFPSVLNSPKVWKIVGSHNKSVHIYHYDSTLEKVAEDKILTKLLTIMNNAPHPSTKVWTGLTAASATDSLNPAALRSGTWNHSYLVPSDFITPIPQHTDNFRASNYYHCQYCPLSSRTLCSTYLYSSTSSYLTATCVFIVHSILLFFYIVYRTFFNICPCMLIVFVLGY